MTSLAIQFPPATMSNRRGGSHLHFRSNVQMPPEPSEPRSLELIAEFDDPDAGECLGLHRVFYPADSITWFMRRHLRIVGRHRRSDIDQTELQDIARTKAKLIQGRPALDFSTGGRIASGPPAIGCRTSAAKEPLTKAPVLSGSVGSHFDAPRRNNRPLAPPERWMPRAYLAFRETDLQFLLDRVRLSTLPVRESHRFADALRQGLPLHAPSDVIYTRVRPTTRDGICAHGFREIASGREYVFHVPGFAVVEARVGEVLPARTRWCRALPQDCCRKVADASGAVVNVCCGQWMADHLLRLWFANQSIRLPWQPDSSFLRSELVAPFMTEVPATSLARDMAPAEPYTLDEIAVFPPLMLSGDESRMTLPGHVELHAPF